MNKAALLTSVFLKVNSALRRINYYPLDFEIDFPVPNTHPLESDLSGGKRQLNGYVSILKVWYYN